MSLLRERNRLDFMDGQRDGSDNTRAEGIRLWVRIGWRERVMRVLSQYVGNFMMIGKIPEIYECHPNEDSK